MSVIEFRLNSSYGHAAKIDRGQRMERDCPRPELTAEFHHHKRSCTSSLAAREDLNECRWQEEIKGYAPSKGSSGAER